VAARGRGLQSERTALSWSRVSLLFTVNALLALRTGWENGSIMYVAMAAALFASAAATVGYGGVRKRQLLNADQPSAPPVSAITVMATITFVACVAGIISVLVAH
jgi:hypothetical protein